MTEEKKLQNFLAKLDKVKKKGPDQWQARCPAHEDKVESLSVSRGDNKINFHCHAGCSGKDILRAMGLNWSDIYFDDEPGKKKKSKVVKEYIYRDENGRPLHKTLRTANKDFLQKRYENGKWKWGLKGVRTVLYKLEEVKEAINNNDVVYLVEGEKDADNLHKIGLTGTCNPLGAGKWKPGYTETLKGARVVILPDNDKPGKKHARNIAKELHGKAKLVKILELPGLDKKEDVSDWLDKGGTKEKLLQLVKDCPEWKPGINNWPDPLPFNNFDVKPIPVNILPNWLSDFAINLAEFTQTPIDMSIMLIISALGTALANKGVVQIRKGYTEPLNIWTCTVLPAGNRKSPVFKKIMKPILDYEERKREEIEPERRHALKEKSILEDQLKQKEKIAGNAKDQAKRKQIMQEIFNLDDEIQEMEIPTLPRLVASDVTTEKLAKLMEDNNGRIAILSPEGDIFKLMAGRYSKNGAANFDNYKKAWTGGEPIRDDRMARKGTYVKNPALTQGLTVQPVILEDLKEKKAFKGEGILGRFLYAIPESPVGSRKVGNEVPELSDIAVMRYQKGLSALLHTRPAGENKNGEWEPHIIKLSPEALEVRYEFERDIEKELGPEGKLHNIADWGSKLVGNITRVAGLLHIAGQTDAQKGQATRDIWNKPIGPETMKKAVKLGYSLIEHALKVYDLLDTDPEIELARYVLKRIMRGKEMEKAEELPKDKDTLDKSILMELCKGKKEIKRPDDLKEPLKLLAELNYITIVERETEGRGRNPSPLIKLNPKVHSINSIKKDTEYNKSNKSNKSNITPEIKKDENGVIIEGMI
ncbi:DUF3987 domain-containing protein [Halothermothrix orenii]|uniref:Uncharacterized protein n=1 Tax=Halothermothrix orenii (strain H 168 / OCM 544 / DSM 9562) TaxID=373903 RepID=B8D1N1_HALOH|nr:DUF3987 domain-containing protein [Halothermothrix orenii]ACL69108.1 hypothetical protein Hore_03470 [Halothermothrix orenii H 168]